MAGEHARLRCSQRNDVILEISRNSLQFPMQKSWWHSVHLLIFLAPVTSCHFMSLPTVLSAHLQCKAELRGSSNANSRE